MSLLNLQNLPGIDAAIESVENEFGWGPNGPAVVIGGTMDSAAVDSTNSPTTLLRRGLVVGRITSSSYFSHYDPTETDGSQEPIGILWQTINMYDPNTGAVRNKEAVVQLWGNVKPGSLYGFDEYARSRLKEPFLFDDLRRPHDLFKPVSKTADYTVLSTDNGTHFFASGANINFTLPAIALNRGYRFRFTMISDHNLTVTAPSGKLVTFNNATATSVAFSTSGNKIGASVEIVGLPDSTKYLALPHGANTMTVA